MTGEPYLRLFGRTDLCDESGSPIPFRTRKQLAVLAYLALEGRERPVRRDALVELLWPGVPVTRGRHSLSQALTAIRACLGGDAVSRGGDAVRLVRPLVTQLNHLREGRAVPLAAQQPLAGLEDAAGAEFAHWVERTRARLAREFADALAEGMRTARSAGNVSRVHECAAQLYGVDPLSDIAVQVLAEERLLSHDRAGAIRLLRAHAARSQGELGCAPSRDVEALLRRLEAGVGMAAPGEPPPPVVSTRAEVFLGREAELARLEAAWERARQGGLERLLVAGPAGIGKSTLLRRFAATVAARACPSWTVCCQEMGRNIPFAALSELIQALCGDPLVSGTDPRWLSEVSRVTPGLRDRYPGVPEPSDVPPEAVRLRVAEAVHHMLDAVAEGGASLLVFDDVQHLDQASRDILYVVARRLTGRKVLLVGTLRTHDGEGGRDGDPALVDGFEWGERVTLAPLDSTSLEAVIAHLCGGAPAPDGTIATRFAEVAQGNPYLVEMLVSDWQRNGEAALVAAPERDVLPSGWRPSEMMRAAFARQHERLVPEAVRVLQLLAVAGRRMALADVASLLGMSDASLTQAVLELVERGIMHVERGALGFKNDMHRAFAYYRLADGVRSYLHARIGDRLAHADVSQDFQRALEASHHYVKADMGEEAAVAACAGAEIALRRGGFREAERALRVALATGGVGSRARTEVLLATVLETEGRYREALDVLELCSSRECSAHDMARRGVTRAAVLLRGLLADQRTVRDAAKDAYALSTASGNSELLYQSLLLRAELGAETGDVQELRSVAALGRDYRRDATGRIQEAMGALIEAACALYSGRPARTVALCGRYVPVMDDAGRPVESRRLRTLEGAAHWCLGRHTDASRAFASAAAASTELGDMAAMSVNYSNLGVTLMETGDYSAAEKYLADAVRLSLESGSPRRHAEAVTNQSAFFVGLGRLEEARLSIVQAQGLATAADSRRLLMLANSIDVDYELARGATEVAWQKLEEYTAKGPAALLPINAGNWERQRRLLLWVQHGYRPFLALYDNDNDAGIRPLRDRLVLRALRKWVGLQEGLEPSSSESVLQELVESGFPGTAAYLAIMGIGTA